MQVSMTAKPHHKSRKNMIKSAFWTIFIFLFIVVSTIFLVKNKKENLFAEEQIFYIVYADVSSNAMNFDSKKELLKNLGGAGNVFAYKNKQYLVANVYLELASANEIKNNLTAYYSDAGVLKLKVDKMKWRIVKKIKSSSISLKIMKFMYDYSKQYNNFELSFMSGKLSETEFLTKLIAKRLELFELCKAEKSSEFEQTFLSFGELVYLQMTNFLDGFFATNAKSSYICRFYVNFIVNYLEFYNSLS